LFSRCYVHDRGAIAVELIKTTSISLKPPVNFLSFFAPRWANQPEPSFLPCFFSAHCPSDETEIKVKQH